jgi:hypothetical protein
MLLFKIKIKIKKVIVHMQYIDPDFNPDLTALGYPDTYPEAELLVVVVIETKVLRFCYSQSLLLY